MNPEDYQALLSGLAKLEAVGTKETDVSREEWEELRERASGSTLRDQLNLTAIGFRHRIELYYGAMRVVSR